MAGHSKWANIKRHKSAVDAKRGQMFTKLIKEITVAARMGGGDISANPRLRIAVDKAKGVSMPKDNIERAIKKGTGELEGTTVEEIVYEGYGPGGVAVIVECATDNKTRTVSEIRLAFSKNGGNMGESGSVGWMFEKKGVIRVPAQNTNEETLYDKLLAEGVEDITTEDGHFVITTPPDRYAAVLNALQANSIATADSNLEMLPKSTIAVTNKDQAEKLLAMIEALEANDDTQNVWANFEMDDALLS